MNTKRQASLAFLIAWFSAVSAYAADVDSPKGADPKVDLMEESILRPLHVYGVYGGAAAAFSGEVVPSVGIAILLKNVAFAKNDLDNWEAGGLIQFYPGNPLWGAVYLSVGYGFFSQNQLVVSGLFGLNAASTTRFIIGLSGGARVSYETPKFWNMSLAPAVSVVSNMLPYLAPNILFNLELRYSIPAFEWRPPAKK